MEEQYKPRREAATGSDPSEALLMTTELRPRQKKDTTNMRGPELRKCVKCERYPNTRDTYVCGNGHTICNRCSKANSRCLVTNCTSRLSPAMSFVLKQGHKENRMFTCSRVACKMLDFRNHTLTCPEIRRYPCWESMCSVAGKKMFNVDELLEHFKNDHQMERLPYENLTAGSIINMSSYTDLSPGIWSIGLVLFKKNSHFVVMFGRHDYGNIESFVAIVYHLFTLPLTPTPPKFRTDLQLRSGTDFRTHHVIIPEVTVDMKTVMRLGGCLIIPGDSIPPGRFLLHVHIKTILKPEKWLL